VTTQTASPAKPTTITAPPALPFVDIVREFDASPAAVFRAHTDPEIYAQWLGPRTMQLDEVILEPTPGGRWHFSFRGDAGEPYAFSGVFHTVQPNALLIHTFEFSLAPGQVGVTTTTFDETNGRTRMSVREVYPSVEARDAAMSSGMEYGIVEGSERLDELLAR
jgi:uncharacterized protein YndB with AHSA1/START domain